MMWNLVFSLTAVLAVCYVSLGEEIAEIDRESAVAGDVDLKNGLVKRAAEPQCPNCRRIGLNPNSCPGCGRRDYEINANINDRHYHYNYACPGCDIDPRRILDISTNINSNNQIKTRFGCTGGNCRMRRSADPDPQCPGGDCRRSCQGGSCFNRRLFDLNTNVHSNNMYPRSWCPDCDRRFLDITTNVNNNNHKRRQFGCTDGSCRMKRSADPDPQCPGGDCRRSCQGGSCFNRRLFDLNTNVHSNNMYPRSWCPDCDRRFLDITTNVNSNNHKRRQFGCTDGTCRMKRSADPDPQCPGGDCRRSCQGGSCFNRRLYDDDTNLRSWCPDCHRRFLDFTTNVNSNNHKRRRFGCTDGTCRMKRSADPEPNPQCSGGNCRRTPCYGGLCAQKRFFDINTNVNSNNNRAVCPNCILDPIVYTNLKHSCPGGNCQMKRSADPDPNPQCSGGNCRRMPMTQCSGGSCRVGIPRCPGGNCHLSQCPDGNCGLSQCSGGNCRSNNRKCPDCDKHYANTHHNRVIIDGRLNGCSGGNCHQKRSAGPQDDMDNITTGGSWR